MVFAVSVERGEHDGEDGGGVVAYQAHDVPGGGMIMKVFWDVFNPLAMDIWIVQIEDKKLTHCSSNRAPSLPLGNADC